MIWLALLGVALTGLVVAATIMYLVPLVRSARAVNELFDVAREIDDLMARSVLPRHDYVLRIRDSSYALAQNPRDLTIAHLLAAAGDDATHLRFLIADFKASADPAQVELMSELQSRFSVTAIRQLLSNHPAWLFLELLVAYKARHKGEDDTAAKPRVFIHFSDLIERAEEGTEFPSLHGSKT